MQSAKQNDEKRSKDHTNSVSFEGIGWKVRLQQKRSYYSITIAKELVLGNMLKKGDNIHYYLVDCNGRKAILAFLDNKERPPEHQITINRMTFLVKN